MLQWHGSGASTATWVTVCFKSRLLCGLPWVTVPPVSAAAACMQVRDHAAY
jgi:hypothetical protein